MKKEDKELLKKVICSMLPYGVKGKIETIDGNGKDIKDDGVLNNVFINEYGKVYICIEGMEYELDDFKPYLRTMSSMTEEEENIVYNGHIQFWDREDYCNKHHLDYRGLIPMGLALEAPEGMYKEG